MSSELWYWQECKTCRTSCTDCKMHSVDSLLIIASCISRIQGCGLSPFPWPHMPDKVNWWTVHLITSCSWHIGQRMDKKPELCKTAGAMFFREGFILKRPIRRHTIGLLSVLKPLLLCNHMWIPCFATCILCSNWSPST